MKTPKKCQQIAPMLLALSPVLFWAPAAQASTFDNSATLSYTINSITNLDNPGSFDGLALTASFELAAEPDYALALIGDGTISGANPGIGPIAIPTNSTGIVFSQPFAVSGQVTNGTVNTSQLGLFGLNFENTGSENYSISIKLDYQLKSEVAGQLADGSVALDYYNEAFSFWGSDRVDASVASLQTAMLEGSSGIFNFTLAPGASEALYGDVRITGNLEAAPVPLPGSFWLLFGGLSAIASVAKRRTPKS